MCLALLTGGLAWGQETDFSPFARFGLGTAQGNLTPALASMAGITSVSTSGLIVNADQPAAAAALLNPTFQGSVHTQRMELTEGTQSANAITGGPGNFGLVVKQPRSLKALQLGLTPMTSKSFGVSRTVTDTALGDIQESYVGSGGLARAYLGLAHGWRGRTWIEAGAAGQRINHGTGFGHGLPDGPLVWRRHPNLRSGHSKHHLPRRPERRFIAPPCHGLVLGAEAFQVIRAKYDEFKQFRGSWTLRLGATWSPTRNLSTAFTRLVESTLILNGAVQGIDTSAFEQATLTGGVPQAWTLGGGLQWDGGRGNRVGMFFDHKQQAWGEANQDLGHLMDGSARWGDAVSTSVGVLWTPGRKPGKLNRSTFRVGYMQAVLPVVLDANDMTSHPLQEWRVSLGMNTPLKGSRSASQLHLGMDVGQRSTDLTSVHQEFSLRGHLGVTLTPFAKNLWLTPRLYD